MAKRKTATAGPSTGLIVTLIFFILTTFIAGTLAYFGYADQEKLKSDAKKATDDSAAKTQLADKRLAAMLTYKMAIGTITPEERGTFADKLGNPTFAADIQAEVDALDPLARNTRFAWLRGPDGKLAAEPSSQFIPLVVEAKTLAKTASDARDQAEKDMQAADVAFKAKESNLKKAITELETQKGKLQNELKEAEKKKTAEFEGLVKALSEKQQQLDAKNAEAAQKAEDDRRVIAARDKAIAELETLKNKYESRNVIGADLVDKDTKKADVDKVDGNYIFLNRGSADLLRPQTTFSVLPPDAVWRTADEKDRLVKGEVEVIEILGPSSARARIVDQRNPIRDPIRARDQLFNIVWNPGMQEHVAFAGIIDINGDGVDDNKAFIQLVEKQGVVIDQYLDLDTRSTKGKGMNIQTKFLVLGPDVVFPQDAERRREKNDPRLVAMEDIRSKMDQMKSDARKLGVQVIDYRKFLTSIGVKLPEKASPVTYDSMGYTKKEDRETIEKENENRPK